MVSDADYDIAEFFATEAPLPQRAIDDSNASRQLPDVTYADMKFQSDYDRPPDPRSARQGRHVYLQMRPANRVSHAIACTASHSLWKRRVLNQIATRRLDLDKALPAEDNAEWCARWRARAALARSTADKSAQEEKHRIGIPRFASQQLQG